MALGLSPCRCSSMIMTSSPSRTTESLPPATGAASADTGLGPVRASPDRPQTRNEVGNIRRPLLGRIHRPPRDGSHVVLRGADTPLFPKPPTLAEAIAKAKG